MQLRLLMNYVQNGVEEPWQKIPSVIALFAAEASFVLLDPSHDHYTTISKLLMQSSRVNMKVYVLFH
jgi:nucleolar pre-ribosomal-associated protein 1